VVKVFLVTYNLQDMPPRSRTFVRQTRCAAAARPQRPSRVVARPGVLTGRTYVPCIAAPFVCSYVDDGSSHAMRFAVHLPFVSPRKGYVAVQGVVRVVFCHWMQDGYAHEPCQGDGRPHVVSPTHPACAALAFALVIPLSNAKLRVVTAEPTPKYTLLDADIDDSSGTDPDGAASADLATGAARPPPSPTPVLSADATCAVPMTLSPVATTAPTSPIRESTALTAVTGAVIPMPLPLHPVSRGFVLADAPTGGPDLIAPPPALVAPLLSPERERSVPFFVRPQAAVAPADDAMEDAADPPPAPPAW